MTATNHALTGAVIALAIRKPELAIPLAFLSHFALDAIPHYNPPNTKARDKERGNVKWAKKLQNKSFIAIFSIDMLLLTALVVVLPVLHPENISSWTIFSSMLAGISPDFIDGRFLIYRIVGIRVEPGKERGRFTYWHDWIQWKDRPWGIWVELVWAVLTSLIIVKLL